MGGEGTKHVGVTSAGFQEGLSPGIYSESLGACWDSDAKPRTQGLGTWPACSEEHSAGILNLRLGVKEEKVSWFSRPYFLLPCPVQL